MELPTSMDSRINPRRARPARLLPPVLGLLAALFGVSDAVVGQEEQTTTASTPAVADPQESSEAVLVPPTPEQMLSLSEGAKPHLARAMARAARRVLARAKPELPHLRLAFAFSASTTSIAPEDVECWRLFLAVVDASDPDNPLVREAEEQALAAISRLDPSDSVILLRRLLLAVEQGHTVEERLERFETLLAPSSVDVIGNDVAARLAFDMALLLSRSGDTDGFAERLAQSVALDPSYPSATATAAVFFGDGEPETDAELFVAALLADPMESDFAAQLGLIALRNGAYSGAARMLGLASGTAEQQGLSSDELALQNAIALWGAGRDSDALAAIAARQRQLEAFAREAAARTAPDGFGIEAPSTDEITVDEPLQMSMLKAAILSLDRDQQGYRKYVASVMKRLVDLMAEESDSLDRPAGDEDEAPWIDPVRFLEAAAFAAWQGEDAGLIDQFVTAARSHTELTPDALGRFEAWRSIARGDLASAIDILTQLAVDDDLATLALSIAYERSGRDADAARLWLRLARSGPGTVIGIWCKHRLEEALGSSLPLTEVAQRIDDLIGQIPSTLDRVMLGRDDGYSLRLEPSAPTVRPFGELLYRMQVVNRMPTRISIGPEGPLLPTAHFATTITVAGAAGSVRTDSLILAIDRIFGIDPNDDLEIELDLSYYPAGEISVVRAEDGMVFDSRVITNFDTDGMNTVPGTFGEKASARLMRVDGITPDAPYRRQAVEAVTVMNGSASLEALLMLTEIALLTPIEEQNPEAIAFRDGVFQILEQRYVELPADARAWIAYALPPRSPLPGYERIVNMVWSDTSILVELALLARLTWSAGVEGARDPLLARLVDSRNPDIAGLAADLREVLEIVSLEEREATSIFGR